MAAGLPGQRRHIAYNRQMPMPAALCGVCYLPQTFKVCIPTSYSTNLLKE